MGSFGFISDKLEIKFLILYIAARVVGPVPFEVMQDLSMCDSGVDYFGFSECLADLVRTGHLAQDEEDRYAITDKGRRNSRICESSLPPSVRWHCDQNLIQVNDALRREAQVRAQILDKEDGTATLCLTLEDGSSPLFHLALLSSSREQAERWGQVFQADPSALYLSIIKLLDQPKEDHHETQ